MLHVDGFFHGGKNGKGVGRMYGIALSVVVVRKNARELARSVSYKVEQAEIFFD